jgi:hypothetical protein
MTASPSSAPLSTRLRLFLGALAAVAITLLAVYWTSPPKVTTATTMENAHGQVTGTSTAVVHDQRSDGVVLALCGLGIVFGLTAISGGRLKFTGPGGVGVEAIATAAAAGQTIGELSARVGTDDPQVQAALERWKGAIEGLKPQ